MDKIFSKLKNETVLIISFAAAVISCFFVPVTDYTAYVNTDTIGILFSLMAITAGLSENGLFDKVSDMLVKKAKTARVMSLVLTLTTFFLSMIVTNDVALITFVPLTVMAFSGDPKKLIYVIVVQTAAANLGSMCTPVGNPQNLYLYDFYKMDAGGFFSKTVPVCLLGLAFICILNLFVKNTELRPVKREPKQITARSYLIVYGMLFLLCVLAVFKVINTLSVFCSVCVVIVIMEPKIFRKVDYSLLFTFVFFFIFVGNVKNITSVHSFMSGIVGGHEFEVSVLLSQIISNVPAAVMMSAFTDNGMAVLLGTDIGGLGTMIASLASLISFRIYSNTENADSGRFMAVFSLVNFILLAILYFAVKYMGLI